MAEPNNAPTLALKAQVIQAFMNAKQKELDLLQQAQKDQLDSANKDDIDNHDFAESPKEQIMEEIEMKAATLDKLKDQIEALKRLAAQPEEAHLAAGPGSLVLTNHANFLIAVPQEATQVQGHTVLGISASAPIYKGLQGLQRGGTFEQAGKTYTITGIV